MRLDGILATTKIHELWRFLYSRLLWNTCCAVTASDSFEFWVGILREKTNGLHMPTVFSCFITSLFCEYACLYLIDRLQSSTIAATITLFIVSVTLILILAPCNNSAIHCSNEELQDMKTAVRKRLVLYCLIVPPLLLLKPLYSTVWIVAAAADAFLLVLAKIGVGIK